MTGKTTLALFAAGLVALSVLGSPPAAEADPRGRHGRFEHSRRQDFRPEFHHQRRDLDRPRQGFHRDVRSDYRKPAAAQRHAGRREIRQDWREIHKDRAELRRDLNEFYRDRAALQRAYRRGASPAEIDRLRGELRDSAREVRESRQELRESYAELRRDRDRLGYGTGGSWNHPGNWNRNERGWWGWGSGWRNWDGGAFDYGRD